ncbi:MAG: hypothetical protein FJY54_16680, partial [Betaproteobacteria bacterium]|nr:hypothetical protein [Betaproteobacteria bacterium]
MRVPPGPPLAPMVARIAEALASDDVAGTRDASQALTDALTARFGLPPIAVAVLSTRPLLRDGDLYGLYEPAGKRRPIRISVWMRTARRNQVVAFRTFLRTLLHEFCHHLDYELYQLPETFHTEGFYKRESRTCFIYRRVMRCGQDGPDARRPTKAICRYGLGGQRRSRPSWPQPAG